MTKFLNFIKNNKCRLLLIYWPIHFSWYEILRVAYAESSVLIIHSPLDDKIPFCEWFIIPYVFWYLYIALVLFYSFRKGEKEFIRADLLVSGCMLLPMIFCTLVPNGIDVAMRPDFATLGRDNFAIELVKFIYNADSPPRNVMPSMHVSVSWALMFAVLKSEGLKNKRVLKIGAVVMSILISLSTVFIKQHSILDVFAGIGTAVLVLVLVNLFEKRFYKNT
ncbi:MAG: phosphatase PAP2 family protein [Ruminococcaceae bacterium]|nr:phosphatase PAP2 family protein [Oscillospiraceae bacterium]